MKSVVNSLIKTLSFKVVQLIVLNCEISLRFEFYEICKKLKIFNNNKEIIEYWIDNNNKADMKNNQEMIKYSKESNITIELSNDEIYRIISLITSVDYYETMLYLFCFIKTDERKASRCLKIILIYMTTPHNKKQQKIQLRIIKKIIKDYPEIKNRLALQGEFYYFIITLNIPLLDFVIEEFEMSINKLCYKSIHWIFYCLNEYPKKNIQLVFEMFDYLLSIGADINYIDEEEGNIYNEIDHLKDKHVYNIMLSKLSVYKYEKESAENLLVDKTKRSKGRT